MRSISNGDIFCIRPGFLFWHEKDEYRYLDKATFKLGALNASAFRILELLDGKTSVEQILQLLRGEMPEANSPPDQLFSEVEEFLSSCLENQFILPGHIEEHLKAYWSKTPSSDGYGFNKPRALYWEITTVCNFSCCFCYNECLSESKGEELTLEQGQQLIEQFYEGGLRSIFFTGGEPTMAFPKLLRWIELCSTLGISTAMFSNGSGITGDSARCLKEAGLNYARVSVHGSDPDMHDLIVGQKGAWDKATEAIQHFGEQDLLCTWLCVVGKYNIEYLRKSVEKAIELGCHGFLAGPLRAIGRGGSEQSRKYMLSPLEELRLLRFFDESLVIYGDKIKLGWGADLGTEEAWKRYVTEPIVPKFDDPDDFFDWCMYFAKNTICGTGARSMGLNAQGQYILCPCLGDITLGSALEISLAEVWQAKELKVLRTTALDDYDECGNCGLKYGCGGGCRANAYNLSGSLTGCDLSHKRAMDWLSEHGNEAVPSFFTDQELTECCKPVRPGSFEVGPGQEKQGPWMLNYPSAWYSGKTSEQ